ncbi:MAG: redox-sensing transcriptional repressor Rex [Pseudomonadota bacterium]|jgi:redox-sensing transcriptional repressor|nr:redox-sensing transcriptional repressor Rex [Pseudomonadota bacterium]
MIEGSVPDVVISRLPRYLQTLNQMAKEGLRTVSSKMLAERLGITAAQIRKDLSFFGGFGKQGTGYSIYYLIEQLQRILNLDRIWQVAVVGAGDLGRALTHYQGFAIKGIEIVLLFDVDPKIVGTKVGSIIVRHADSLEREIKEQDIKIAILTVPAEAAQSTADRLVRAGIKAILNYAPVTLMLPDGVHVQHIDPVLHLQQMMYYLGEYD